MSQLKHWVISLVSSIAIATGIGLVNSSPMFGSSDQFYGARSLDELMILRDRLIQEIETPSEKTSEPSFFSSLFPSDPLAKKEELLQKLKRIEISILVEQRANDSWKQALRLGNQALAAEQKLDSSIDSQKQLQVFWQNAVSNLSEIPENSLLGKSATEKIKQYQNNLAIITQKIEVARASILEQIRQQSGLGKQAMISVCNLQRNCVNLRGDQPPASPASLIKVPVAIALLHKTAKDQINLEEKIYVDGGNFTEDASDIRARQSYSLKALMGQMIDHSSNIATNQLIDYLSQNYINQFLQEKGYQKTEVKFKLMGDRIMPRRPGSGRNRLTSNELTEMMVQTYNQEYPDANVLIEALHRQTDRLLGFAGLEGLPVQWLGEKTGQNSRVLGTTLAVNINGEPYIITVIDNNTGSTPGIRKSVHLIAQYILENGHL